MKLRWHLLSKVSKMEVESNGLLPVPGCPLQRSLALISSAHIYVYVQRLKIVEGSAH